ncbi:MAG TPA: 6-phosphogluconolactonase [Verrucomicrobiae bacterium]|nr:6-phosphogluconolactonase [Verrucomicrobiae bacterium]
MPARKFEINSFPTSDALVAAVAGAWLDEIEAANRAGKSHYVALIGGRIIQKFFLATAEMAVARKVSFAGVQFFWADERCVPPDNPESNFKSANDLLLAPLQIASGQLHRLRGELPPEEAVAQAIGEFARIVPLGNGQSVPVLDLIFLSPGEDGHVASLFQNARSEGQTNAKCNDTFIYVTDSPKPPPRRISLNYNAIAAARQVWVLASGAGKEDALRQSVNTEGQMSGEKTTSLGRVINSRPMTKIFVDIPFRME